MNHKINIGKTIFQGKIVKILPLLIMGLMALSAGILTFFLPETLGAPLPMTIEDAENFGELKTLRYGVLEY